MDDQQKILIVGGYGYLGSYISECFLTHGFAVWILGRKKQNHLDHYQHHFVSCDLSRESEVSSKIPDEKFDLVINASGQAGHQSPDYSSKAEGVHLNGTENLLTHFSIKNYYHISSFHAYGKYDGVIDEMLTAEPKIQYGKILLKTEQLVSTLCHQQNIPFNVFRLSNGYGRPHNKEMTQWQLLHNAICKSIHSKEIFSLKSHPESERDFIYLGDVANVLLQCFLNRREIPALLNLSRGQSFSMQFVMHTCRKAFNELSIDHQLEIPEEASQESVEKILVKNELLRIHVDYEFTDRILEETKKIIQLLSTEES